MTNDAVQNKCADYGKFENGNKVSDSRLTCWIAFLCWVLKVPWFAEHKDWLYEDGATYF